MPENLTELGVGAAVALLILDRVFNFLRNVRNNHGKGKTPSAGELPPDYWDRRYDKLEAMHMTNLELLKEVKIRVEALVRWKGDS